MVMVSATEMINKAHEGHYTIGAFNLNNLEWTKAVLAGVQQANSPVILQVSEGAGKYMGGFKTVADMVRDLHDSMGITVPVALHLDHGTFEGAKACIEAGFTSIMFDGSHYDFEENLKKSKEIIELAHSKGISVECEVGGIGGTEDGVTSAGELADPKECAAIAELGVDFLAAGIGNIHGINVPSIGITNKDGEYNVATGVILEVYEDKVISRARDFGTGEYIPEYTVTYELV